MSSSFISGTMLDMERRPKLTTAQRLEVLALIARGDSNRAVLKYIEDNFQLTMTESAISKIKSVHKETIHKIQDKMLDAQAIDAAAIMNRARAHIQRKLQKAELADEQLDDLAEQYRAGTITIEEYRRKKTGLTVLTIPELVRISGAMHSQNKTDPLPPETPTLPAGTQSRTANLDMGHFQAIVGALQAGNTVELQRIILGGKPDDQPNVVPPEPTTAVPAHG